MTRTEREPESGVWIGRLEAEIARELGQTLTLAAGGNLPESRAISALLELPGARLRLAVEREGLAGVLVEGRLIESAQSDEETLCELWAGILTSVAARLEGKMGGAIEYGEPVGEPCTLRLGSASMRMALAVEASAAPRESPPPRGNYDLLLEVELDALVRFGSREMEMKDLLELGPGDVVELDRQVSDPVDLIIGDKIVARGEVVLVNGNFGLRVTEVSEPVRRLESIRCLV